MLRSLAEIEFGNEFFKHTLHKGLSQTPRLLHGLAALARRRTLCTRSIPRAMPAGALGLLAGLTKPDRSGCLGKAEDLVYPISPQSYAGGSPRAPGRSNQATGLRGGRVRQNAGTKGQTGSLALAGHQSKGEVTPTGHWRK